MSTPHDAEWLEYDDDTRPVRKDTSKIPYSEATPRERMLAEALAYYADPATYFGIAMIGDPPHGDFFDDFEKYPFPGDYSIQDKPGRRARQALSEAFLPSDPKR
jgi:hypothetical protein